jgi:hypothetical protein
MSSNAGGTPATPGLSGMGVVPINVSQVLESFDTHFIDLSVEVEELDG